LAVLGIIQNALHKENQDYNQCLMCWDEVDSIAKSSERPKDKRQPVE
jgi:hypothetical protein